MRDQTRAVLPGVEITATQTDTGIVRTTVTNETGSYVLPNLPIGPYRLEAALPGFRTWVQTGIVLQVNSNAVIDPVLEVGQVSEQVEVQANAALVETRSVGVGQVIENQRILELPLNGRNPVELIVLAGAAVTQVSTSTGAFIGSQGSRTVSVAGGLGSGTAYSLDGATHNNPYDNLNLPLPFPDALQEFRVETSALSAQTGMHSGASVNAVTKSGTNELHGDIFEFLRDRRFNATNPFSVAGPDGKRKDDGLNRNQYGGVLGGPIKKNKLFFFGGYQGTRIRQTPASNISFVPTPAMLAGDFTAFASPACNAGRQITLRDPFVNNRIDPAQLDRIAVAIAKKLPTSTDPCGKVVYTVPSPSNEWQTVGKIDYQLLANHSMFGRYMATRYHNDPIYGNLSDNLLTATATNQHNLAQSLTYGDTVIFSPTALNALRLAFNRTAVFRDVPNTFSAPSVGINIYSYTNQSIFNVNNAFTIGSGSAGAHFNTTTYQVNDDITLSRGKHQWAFGGSIAKWFSFSTANIRSPGPFTFNGQFTGLSVADFLTGKPSEFRQTAPNFLDMKQWYYGLYGQDSWRVSPRLTLNYGVRWEPYMPQYVKNGYVFTFDQNRYLQSIKSKVFKNAPAGLIYPGDDGFVGQNVVGKHLLKFSPRVGVAWDVRGDGRMSIRSSYGLANDFPNARLLLNTSLSPPWSSEVVINAPAGGLQDPYRGVPSGNPFPLPTPLTSNAPFPSSGQYIAPQPGLTNTLVHSWNISFQQQFGSNWAGSVSYLGNRATHLWNALAQNYGVYIPGGPCTLPDGQTYNPCSTTANINARRFLSMKNWPEGRSFGNLDLLDDHGYQRYHGLQVTVQRQGRNVSLNGNYTFSSCIGTPNQQGGVPNAAAGYVNPTNIDYDKGKCDLNKTHIANITGAFETPSHQGALGAIGSHWRLSNILQISSGSWLNVTTGIDNALSGNAVATQRPNKVMDNPYGNNTVNNYLNPAAFAQPAPGTFGNLPFDAVQGPMRWQVDTSLTRTFSLHESQRLEVRIEAFNLFNRFQFGNPVLALNSPTFGRILSAGDPRIMQFALKYLF